MSTVSYVWRVAATGLCFAGFGLGGLFLSLLIVPAVWIVPAKLHWKRDIIHSVIHLSSRLFVWILCLLGIMTLAIEGREKLADRKARFVVANHPSLIDVILLNALIGKTACIVKEAVWYNPFMSGVARAAGYISKSDPQEMLHTSARILQSGRSLIVFPEGSRTPPRRPLRFQRGAANISLCAARDITPVTIEVTPSTLTKEKSWYEVPPDGPFHVTLTVGNDIEVEPFLRTQRPVAARHLNAVLQEYFARGARH